MGLVSQEPVLFNDTIRGNIAYGKGGNATEAEILAAAELANAHKFISALHQVRHDKQSPNWLNNATITQNYLTIPNTENILAKMLE